MDDIKAKQEVVEKIKNSTNILITVSNDPSVDALSAALGLTLALEKQEKYATAIFSGAVPPAIAFLEPEKVFEENTDSLRDFIIALNKQKADHLRYKVDGDYVKIFITPYKTTITPEDLEFSQGDFNVELVIALGVDNQENLDGALENHGQILHDATVITVTVGDQTSSLGGIDWHDPQSSSLSEVVVSLVQALKDDKKSSLIDGQVATALLTGIVAETDRFSNAHTTSKVMTVAADLMAAGADQQLIAFKLQQSHEISGGGSAKTDESTSDSMSIAHKDEKSGGDLPTPSDTPTETSVSNAYALDDTETPTVSEPTSDATTEKPAEETPVAEGEKTDTPAPEAPTEEKPAESTDSSAEDSGHSYIGAPSPSSAYAMDEPATASIDQVPAGFPGTPAVAPGSVAVNDTSNTDEALVHSAYAPEEELPVPTDAPAVPSTEPTTPASAAEPVPVAAPADLGLPLPPPLPDFSAGVTPPPALPLPPIAPPERLGDILTPDTSTPTLPPVDTPAPEQPAAEFGTIPPPPVAPTPDNPGQFKIPGQS